MQKWIKILFLVLVVQILLTAWVFRKGEQLEAFSPDEKMFTNLSITDLDEVRINGEGKTVVLKKADDSKWILPKNDDFPVAANLLETIESKAINILKSFPVGVSDEAAKQLKVADDKFERKIEFVKGDQVKDTLILGSSPGFKKVHARVQGQKNIYAIESSAYDFSLDPQFWYDKEILSVKKEEIDSLLVNNIAIKTKDKNSYEIDGLLETEELNDSEIKNIVAKATSLRFTQVLGKTWDVSKAEQVFKYTIKLKNNSNIDYAFYNGATDKEYVLFSSKLPYYFKVDGTNLSTLKDLTREKLVKIKEVEATPVSSEEPKQSS